MLPVGTKLGATKNTLPSFGSDELFAENVLPWSKTNSIPLVPSDAPGRSVMPTAGEPPYFGRPLEVFETHPPVIVRLAPEVK